MARQNWTLEEERQIVRLYDRMLSLQSAGMLGPKRSAGQTSKRTCIAEWQAETSSERSVGSIEAKLMNVSYCQINAGLPVVIGYKPLSNCSQTLLDAYDLERDDCSTPKPE